MWLYSNQPLPNQTCTCPMWFFYRFGHSIFMSIAGLSLTLTIFVPKNMTSLIIALSMIGKLAIGVSYGTIYIYTTELFPTEIRNAGVGTASMCARIGNYFCYIKSNLK